METLTWLSIGFIFGLIVGLAFAVYAVRRFHTSHIQPIKERLQYYRQEYNELSAKQHKEKHYVRTNDGYPSNVCGPFESSRNFKFRTDSTEASET